MAAGGWAAAWLDTGRPGGMRPGAAFGGPACCAVVGGGGGGPSTLGVCIGICTMFCLAGCAGAWKGLGPVVDVHGGGRLVSPFSSTSQASRMPRHVSAVMAGLAPGVHRVAAFGGRGLAEVILLPSAPHTNLALACAEAFSRTMSDVGDGAGSGVGSKSGAALVLPSVADGAAADPAVAGGTEGCGFCRCAGCPWTNWGWLCREENDVLPA